MTFSNHFSNHSQAYKAFRPSYPPELIAFLASTVKRKDCAWDCATGNGQAALALAEHFTRVIATDGSANQIRNATAHERVEYRVALAEDSGLPSQSVDLVTVAQALHWFDFDKFYEEVRRVGNEHSVFATFTYPLIQSADPKVNAILTDFYENIVGPYWPPERVHIDDGYANIPFPFKRIATPTFQMRKSWNLEQFLNYLGTWSAVQRYKEKERHDPVADLVAKPFANAWGGNVKQEKEFATDLILRVGYIHEVP